MSTTHKFTNSFLQRLHEIVNSSTVANLKTTSDIYNVLYPYVRAVIDNPAAYEESKTSSIYKCISQHIETKISTYERMDLNVSMCFTLYMYIYH